MPSNVENILNGILTGDGSGIQKPASRVEELLFEIYEQGGGGGDSVIGGIKLTIDENYVMTATLVDKDGEEYGVSDDIDLPLEEMVVDAEYDPLTQKIKLELKNGNYVEFSVAELVSGLQTELSSSNKLNPAYIDYDASHRAVSDTEKDTWNAKQNAISDLETIRSGAAAGATAVQPSALETALSTKQDTISDLAAIRSGASAGATAVQPATMSTALALKQDSLSEAQLAAVNSGINSTKVEQISTNQTNILSVQEEVNDLQKKAVKVYSFHVNPNESNPTLAVTYLDDAVGMTPAKMGEESFDYGSWENAWFMPKPCMLKSNGTVDYYLDPNDYSKKADGTASDIGNINYDGNVMMEFPKIWVKRVTGESEGEYTVSIAPIQIDNNYHCFSNINAANAEVDHFYIAAYNGTVDSSNKLRSLSGVTMNATNAPENYTREMEINAAKANNVNNDHVAWYTAVWSDTCLIFDMLRLMGKSLDLQRTYGYGVVNGDITAKRSYVTGSLNGHGLFYGAIINKTTAVKVLGIENLWGLLWKANAGLINDNGTLKVKMTYGTADGSTATEYNTTGLGYLDYGSAHAESGYIKKMQVDSTKGYKVVEVGANDYTYYCDRYYSNNEQVNYGLVCGASNTDAYAGMAINLSSLTNLGVWVNGTSLSCKPYVLSNDELTKQYENIKNHIVYAERKLFLQGTTPTGDIPVGSTWINGKVIKEMGRTEQMIDDSQLMQGGYSTSDGSYIENAARVCTAKIPIISGEAYTITPANQKLASVVFFNGDTFVSGNVLDIATDFTFTADNNIDSVIITYKPLNDSQSTLTPTDIYHPMMNQGSSALPYIPYYDWI